jgi:hypothetical protein
MTTKPTSPNTPPSEGMIAFTSGVSQRTGEPFIHIHWGSMEGQLTPAEALEHAQGIIEAVEAAYSDSFLVGFLTEKVKTPPEIALHILGEFRAYRAAMRERGL